MPFDPSPLLNTCIAALLLYSMAQDILTHRIHNRVWIFAAVILIPLRLLVHLHDPSPFGLLILWGSLITALAYLLWQTKTWGGADAKGTILLAWAVPIMPILGTWIHPIMLAIPISLALVLAVQKFKPAPLPFYSIYSPVILLSLFIFWII